MNSVFTTQMKCAVVSTLISLAFVSQAFAVFSAKRNKRCRIKMHSSNQANALPLSLPRIVAAVIRLRQGYGVTSRHRLQEKVDGRIFLEARFA